MFVVVAFLFSLVVCQFPPPVKWENYEQETTIAAGPTTTKISGWLKVVLGSGAKDTKLYMKSSMTIAGKNYDTQIWSVPSDPDSRTTYVLSFAGTCTHTVTPNGHVVKPNCTDWKQTGNVYEQTCQQTTPQGTMDMDMKCTMTSSGDHVDNSVTSTTLGGKVISTSTMHRKGGDGTKPTDADFVPPATCQKAHIRQASYNRLPKEVRSILNM